MDLILHVADELVLDSLWAKLVPLSTYGSAVSGPCGTGSNRTQFLSTHTPKPWTSILNTLPQPSIPCLSPEEVKQAAVSAWPRDYVPRQILSVIAITSIGIHVLYFLFAYLSYRFIFNHDMMKHPRFLENQIRKEILCSLWAFPWMTLLTLPWFQGEVMGYSQLYDDPKKYGYPYLVFSAFFFLVFTDYCVYWIHRWLHIPWIYKRLHKPHHKWIIPTPFASHAFHPVDGYLQSVPYHLFIFLFPLHRYLYIVLFIFVNFWSIFIHDSDMITGHPLENIINGPAHHTLHHIYFTCNYGQYFTWADRFGNSYRHPQSDLDPLLEVKALEKKTKGDKAL